MQSGLYRRESWMRAITTPLPDSPPDSPRAGLEVSGFQFGGGAITALLPESPRAGLEMSGFRFRGGSNFRFGCQNSPTDFDFGDANCALLRRSSSSAEPAAAEAEEAGASMSRCNPLSVG